MQGHDGLDDRQPQPVGFGEGAARAVAAIETVEHARHGLGRDILAVVLDHDAAACAIGIVFGEDADRAVGLSVSHRIDDQVADRAPPHDQVGMAVASGLQFETHAAFVGDAFEVIADAAQFFRQIQRAALHRQAGVVGLGQEEDVLDDAREPLQFFHIRFQHLFILFRTAALAQCDLALSHQHIDGGADLVGQVAGKLRQMVIAGLQPVQHGIEGERHASQFGGHAVLVQPCRQVVRRDLGGALAHRLQRLQAAPQQQEAQQ